jgi:NADP-dependent 3-hydroxy acid dehydrogenase YdfG
MNNQYKVAFVTGASVGIGLEIARRFSQQGMSLVLLARRREKLEQLARELSVNAPCHIIACDIRDMERVGKEIDNLPEAFSQVDVLVNNAGLSLGLVPAQSADWPDWRQMIETNCTA